MPRRRKSREEHELLGNARARNAKPNRHAALVGTEEATKAAPIGQPPFGVSAAARKVWKIAVESLKTFNLLQKPDAIAFERYCGWLARYLDLERGSRRLKIVETTKSRAVKMMRIDKKFQALLLLDKRLMDYEDRFGMNPRDRQLILMKLAAGHAALPQAPNHAEQPADDGAPALPDTPIGMLSGPTRVQ